MYPSKGLSRKSERQRLAIALLFIVCSSESCIQVPTQLNFQDQMRWGYTIPLYILLWVLELSFSSSFPLKHFLCTGKILLTASNTKIQKSTLFHRLTLVLSMHHWQYHCKNTFLGVKAWVLVWIICLGLLSKLLVYSDKITGRTGLLSIDNPFRKLFAESHNTWILRHHWVTWMSLSEYWKHYQTRTYKYSSINVELY